MSFLPPGYCGAFDRLVSPWGLALAIALLQRKTLIETKNRILKCLKWHYLTVQSMKNVAMLT